MLKAHTETNLHAASNYFREHLSSGDYYSNQGATPGVWIGKGASILGLAGKVQESDFLHLCAGEKPDGSKLTKRLNTVRQGNEPNRRIFYDWVFSPPKSVSLAALVAGDERILKAHGDALASAARELEKFACVRIRSKNDPDNNGGDRRTGNLTMAAFSHTTSRAVAEGELPDPHLHDHLLVFNVTRDKDNQLRALQNYEMLKNQKYISAIYDHELCRSLRHLGYGIRQKGDSWELAHVPDDLCEKFSKRHRAIENETALLEQNGAKSEHERLKDRVAHDKRIRKSGNLSNQQLRQGWLSQLSELEKSILEKYFASRSLAGNEGTASEAVNWTLRHLFERSAVVSEHDFLATALHHLRGCDFSICDLKSELEKNQTILREASGDRITTQEALECEKAILRIVEDGKNRFAPFALGLINTTDTGRLSPLQREAAEYLLFSKDRVSVFRGSAGVGKSTTLRPVSDALVKAGYTPVVLAPQNRQVVGLIKDGFSEAKTVSSFLATENTLDNKSVLILDEAGQVGGANMLQLLSKAKEADCRVILVGDTNQHCNISRSSALLAIQKYSNPHMAQLSGEKAIIRQKVAAYRSAVASAENGNTAESWKLLDSLESIKETTAKSKIQDAARYYVERLATGESILMLSQTNSEVDLLNSEIRNELCKSKRLDLSKSFNKCVLKQIDLTSAQKEKAPSYPDNSVVLLNRRIGRIKSGSKGYFVRQGKNSGIICSVNGKEVEITIDDLDRITVYSQYNLQLSTGDKIALKTNIRIGNHKLSNGQIVSVVAKDRLGCLFVQDEYNKIYKLPATFNQIQYGYAVTSYASQSSTVDNVIICDSGSKLATSQKQFYVSISRGRKSCTIFTADKELLKRNISAIGDQTLAVDLKLRQRETATPARSTLSSDNLPPNQTDGFQCQPSAKNQCVDTTGYQKIECFCSKNGSRFWRGLSGFPHLIIGGLELLKDFVKQYEIENER